MTEAQAVELIDVLRALNIYVSVLAGAVCGIGIALTMGSKS